MTDQSRIAAVYAATTAGAVLWVAAILAAPYLWARGLRFSLFLYACFSPVCHQVPARSFWLFGHPLAVCARCFGVYAGFLGGLALFPFVRGFRILRPPSVRAIALISAPIVADTAGQFFHLWETGAFGRFGTGFLWGVLLPFLFVPALADLAIHLSRRRHRRESSPPPA